MFVSCFSHHNSQHYGVNYHTEGEKKEQIWGIFIFRVVLNDWEQENDKVGRTPVYNCCKWNHRGLNDFRDVKPGDRANRNSKSADHYKEAEKYISFRFSILSFIQDKPNEKPEKSYCHRCNSRQKNFLSSVLFNEHNTHNRHRKPPKIKQYWQYGFQIWQRDSGQLPTIKTHNIYTSQILEQLHPEGQKFSLWNIFWVFNNRVLIPKKSLLVTLIETFSGFGEVFLHLIFLYLHRFVTLFLLFQLYLMLNSLIFCMSVLWMIQIFDIFEICYFQLVHFLKKDLLNVFLVIDLFNQVFCLVNSSLSDQITSRRNCCKAIMPIEKPKLNFQYYSGSKKKEVMYGIKYPKKEPKTMEGAKNDPIKPEISTGTYYLTVKGTIELQIPTEAPCITLPTKSVFIEGTITINPAMKAIILAIRKDCLNIPQHLLPCAIFQNESGCNSTKNCSKLNQA